MAANRIKGITIEIGGDTTKLQTSLKGVNTQVKSTQVSNVMYIALDPEKLKKITFPGDRGDGTFEPTVQKLDNDCFEIEESPEAAKTADAVGGGTKFCMTPHNEMYDHMQNYVPPHTNEGGTLLQNNVGPLTEFRGTNTEITSENTDRDYPSIHLTVGGGEGSRPDGMDGMTDRAYGYRELVYENTNYRWHMENDDIIDREKFKGLKMNELMTVL